MFDIGFWELFLLLVLALVVIGPERLPAAARTVGFWIGKARRFVEGVKTDVEQDLDVAEFKRLMHNQEVQISELQRKLSDTVDLSGDDQPEHHYHSDDEIHEELPDYDDVDELLEDPATDDVDDLLEDPATDDIDDLLDDPATDGSQPDKAKTE